MKRLSSAMAVAALALGCNSGPAQHTDGGSACAAGCNGCCAPNGTCITPSNTTAACGAVGAVCQVCTGNQSCTGGRCVDSSCGGCISGEACEAGNAASACGTGGVTCAVCNNGQSCTNGVCTGSTSTGSVGANGGSVSSLYFAIVGDTRPQNEDDTSNYPTAVITKIFQDLEAMNPKPQFIVTTGDYMYANPSGSQGAAQVGLYMQAESAWTGGAIFHAMGNHECNGYTNSNLDLSTGSCDGSSSNNYAAFFQQMVQPLGKTLPYYTIPVNATDGSWTAKFIIVACNAWDSTQQGWLQSQLNQSTKYTFLVRHEDPGADGPCVSQMDSMLQSATYDLLIVGHSHEFQNDYSNGKYIIVGNGGAGSSGFGYVTIQQGSSGFTGTSYDYSTASPNGSFSF